MLALLMAAPAEARPYVERLTAEHFSSPILRRTFEWLREHLDDPLEGLAEDDGDLYNAVVRLKALDHEPPTAANLDFRWRLLDRDRMQRELRAAEAEGDSGRIVALQRELGELKDSIASRNG